MTNRRAATRQVVNSRLPNKRCTLLFPASAPIVGFVALIEPESRQSAAQQVDDMILGLPGLRSRSSISDDDGQIVLSALGSAIDQTLNEILQWPLPQEILFLLELLEAKALGISGG